MERIQQFGLILGGVLTLGVGEAEGTKGRWGCKALRARNRDIAFQFLVEALSFAASMATPGASADREDLHDELARVTRS